MTAARSDVPKPALAGTPSALRRERLYRAGFQTLGTGTFYLLVCRECGSGDLVMPFTSQASRGKWADGHTRGTGHGRWFVTDTAVLRANGLGSRPGDVITAMARHDEVLRGFAGG